MIKSLKDARITDVLPRIVREEDWVKAMSGALGRVHVKTLDYADRSQIYTALDTVPEHILDALAVNWKIDWYNTEYSATQKRRIVKTVLEVRRLMGTVWAVRRQLTAIYPDTTLEEWFTYGGHPGCFRVRVFNPEIPPEIVETALDDFYNACHQVKRLSAHLDYVEMITELPEENILLHMRGRHFSVTQTRMPELEIVYPFDDAIGLSAAAREQISETRMPELEIVYPFDDAISLPAAVREQVSETQVPELESIHKLDAKIKAAGAVSSIMQTPVPPAT